MAGRWWNLNSTRPRGFRTSIGDSVSVGDNDSNSNSICDSDISADSGFRDRAGEGVGRGGLLWRLPGDGAGSSGGLMHSMYGDLFMMHNLLSVFDASCSCNCGHCPYPHWSFAGLPPFEARATATARRSPGLLSPVLLAEWLAQLELDGHSVFLVQAPYI